ncbi:MAG: hypothetical protein J7K96_09210 [Desulfobacteraceae bacterium]|nr:hypothetical protein [Desulfobacteraceae bacterium]
MAETMINAKTNIMISKLQLTLCFIVMLYLVSSLVCDIKCYQTLQSEAMSEIKREDEMKIIIQSRLNALLRLMENENICSNNKERLTKLKHNLKL